MNVALDGMLCRGDHGWASLVSGGALKLNYWLRGGARRAKTPISEKGLQAIMKRATFAALLALVCLAGSSGCCCMYRLFCWGCRGPCAYGNEGPGYGCSSCGGRSGASRVFVQGPRDVLVAGLPTAGQPRRSAVSSL